MAAKEAILSEIFPHSAFMCNAVLIVSSFII